MTDNALPIKDPDHEHPIAEVWRDTFRAIVAHIVAGDYELGGIPGVRRLSRDQGLDVLRDRIANYGDVTLIELPDATWETSVAMWAAPDHWDVLIDLHTVEEGRSDLVLGARVAQVDDGFSYDVHMIYVPQLAHQGVKKKIRVARYAATPGNTTAPDGVVSISATATDTAAQTATDTNSVTVDNVADPTMHVGDLDAAISTGRGGVSHAGLIYDSGDNHDPDVDSNGTAIIVPQP